MNNELMNLYLKIQEEGTDMNNELMNLYLKIQDKRGRWQIGDKFYMQAYGYGTVVGIPDEDRLAVWFDGGWEDELTDSSNEWQEVLWIPPVSSPTNPKRSMIGMFGDQAISYLDPYYENGEVYRWGVEISDFSKKRYVKFFGPTLEFAMAKALVWWRIERN